MEEIKAILKKNDIAGIVVLHKIEGEASFKGDLCHVKGFTEFLFHINTSYSAATIENDRFKVKGKSIHYPSKKERDIQLANTVNMFEHLSKWSTNLSLQAIHMQNMVDKMVQKEDGDEGTTTSHSQQNN